jgi:hypothetical protein
LDPKTVDRLWSRIINHPDPTLRSVAFVALYMARYGRVTPPSAPRALYPDQYRLAHQRSRKNELAALAGRLLVREREIRSLYVHEVDLAFTTYGDGDGVRVSGVFRNHFPDKVKARLRYLIRAASGAQDFSYFLWKYTGRHTETWREVRSRIWTLERNT